MLWDFRRCGRGPAGPDARVKIVIERAAHLMSPLSPPSLPLVGAALLSAALPLLVHSRYRALCATGWPDHAPLAAGVVSRRWLCENLLLLLLLLLLLGEGSMELVEAVTRGALPRDERLAWGALALATTVRAGGREVDWRGHLLVLAGACLDGHAFSLASRGSDCCA